MIVLSLVLGAALWGADDPAFASSISAERIYEDGLRAYEARKYVEATELLNEAVERDPADVDAMILLGKTYQAQGDQMPIVGEEDWNVADSFYEKSESILYQAIDVDAECARAWAELGNTLIRRGKSEEALATLYHAQGFPQAGIEVRLALADALLLSRQYALELGNHDHAMTRLEEAESILEQAMVDLEQYVGLLRRHAEVKAQRGETKEALRSYRQAITLRPDDTLLHDGFMSVVEQSQEVEPSIEFYKGLVDAPALSLWYGAVCQELRGHLAFNRDRDFGASSKAYLGAEQMLLKSVESNPVYEQAAYDRVPYIRSYRGYALTRLGALEEAEAAFVAALDRNPGLENARKGLKSLMDEYWAQIGGEDATEADFDKIRSFAARVCVVLPKDPDVWNNYGFFARESGRYEESYQAYRRAMMLAPDNARILNDTALILVYHLHRDLDLAEQWLLEAKDIAEEDRYNSVDGAAETFGDTLVNLVTLYYLVDEMDQAKAVFDRLQEELPDRAELKFWEARLYPDRVQPEEEAVPVSETPDTPPPVLNEQDASDE